MRQVPTYVYAIECAGYIKVGVARLTRDRLRALDLTCPLPMTLVGRRQYLSAEDALAAEKRIYAVLLDQAHKGEWFTSSPINPVGAVTDDFAREAEAKSWAPVLLETDPAEPQVVQVASFKLSKADVDAASRRSLF